MTLKQWRLSKGYTLHQVGAMLSKTSPTTVHYWEKNGIKRDRIQTDLKRISLGAITDFGAENV